jgi:hypothetical protein
MVDVTERGVFERVVRRRRTSPADLGRHGAAGTIDDAPPRWQDRPRVLQGLDPRARFWRVMEALLPPRLLATLEAAEDTLSTRRPGPPGSPGAEPVLMPRLTRAESWPPVVEGQAHDPRQLNFSFNFVYAPAVPFAARFEAPQPEMNVAPMAAPVVRVVEPTVATPPATVVEDDEDPTVPRTRATPRREPQFEILPLETPADPPEPVAVPLPPRLRETAANDIPNLADEPLVLRARDLGDPPWDRATHAGGNEAATDPREEPDIVQAKRPRRRRLAADAAKAVHADDAGDEKRSNPRLFLFLVGLLVLLILAAAIAIHPDDFGFGRTGDAGAGPNLPLRRVVYDTVEPNEAERITAERSRQFVRFLLDDAQRLRPGPEKDRALERVIDFALEADQPDEALKIVPAMSRRRDVDRALWRIFSYSVERRRLNLADQVAFQFSYDSDRERARQIVVDAGARLLKP